MQQAIESDSIDEPGAAAAGAALRAAFGERYAAPILLSSRPGGETLRATDSQSGREVVVKLLPARLVSPGARMRLEHDAAVLRQVSSHWVSPLLDIAWAGDRLCLVRSFVSGGSLAARLRGGRLDLADTLTVGRCLLSALKELHANGIMHRDVRPAHLVVGEEAPLAGAVLIDCDLARITQSDVSVDEQVARCGALPFAGTDRLAGFRCRRIGRSLLGRSRAFRVPCRTSALRGRKRGRDPPTAHDRSGGGTAESRSCGPSGIGRGHPAAASQGPARPLPVRRGGALGPGRHCRGDCGRWLRAGHCDRFARSPPHADGTSLRRPPS